MKWFKHFTDARTNEKMKALDAEFGLVGIARYWLILELIASKMDETDRCHYEQSEEQWCRYLVVRRPLLRRYLVVIQLLFSINVITNQQQIRIEIPNLLKYRDNFTRNLQVTCKQDVEVEEEVEEEKHVLSAKASFAQKTYLTFSSLWEDLPPPMKKGKKRAWLNFKTQVGTEKDLQDVSKAVKNYLADMTYIRENQHPERQYKNGSTFFDGEWRDWINWTPPKKPPEESVEEGYLRRKKERADKGEINVDD